MKLFTETVEEYKKNEEFFKKAKSESSGKSTEEEEQAKEKVISPEEELAARKRHKKKKYGAKEASIMEPDVPPQPVETATPPVDEEKKTVAELTATKELMEKQLADIESVLAESDKKKKDKETYAVCSFLIY